MKHDPIETKNFKGKKEKICQNCFEKSAQSGWDFCSAKCKEEYDKKHPPTKLL